MGGLAEWELSVVAGALGVSRLDVQTHRATANQAQVHGGP